MSAIALLVSQSATVFSVGAVNFSGLVGFTEGSFGTITPTMLKGDLPVVQLISDTSAPNRDLALVINGSDIPQDVFTRLLVETAPGVYRSFASADAEFFHLGASGTWRWGTGSNPVWDASDGGTTRQAIFYY